MRKERLDIIFEDKNIIVVNKPAHLLTISTEREREKTLFHRVSEYEKKKHKSNKVFIVHRLDKDTSGVLVFAKNIKVKSLLQDNWDNLVKCREYIAIVEGVPKESHATIKSYLKENKNYVTFSSPNPTNGKLAITKYKLLTSNERNALLKIHIETGRKNQIRVHLNDIGNPIVGDKKYGAKSDPIKRMCLHAKKLVIIHPVTKELLTLEAQIPVEFYKIFDKKTFTLWLCEGYFLKKFAISLIFLLTIIISSKSDIEYIINIIPIREVIVLAPKVGLIIKTNPHIMLIILTIIERYHLSLPTFLIVIDNLARDIPSIVKIIPKNIGTIFVNKVGTIKMIIPNISATNPMEKLPAIIFLLLSVIIVIPVSTKRNAIEYEIIDSEILGKKVKTIPNIKNKNDDKFKI